jgi:FHA domain
MKCPFCGYANEDGVLFCDKCKADVETPAGTVFPEPPIAMNDPLSPDVVPTLEPVVEAVPMPVGHPEVLAEVVAEAVSTHIPQPIMPEPAPSIAETTAPAISPDAPTVPGPGAPEAAAAAVVVATPAAPDKSTDLKSELKPKLVVLRGMKIDKVYPLYPGKNYLGRTDDKPVDIDLDEQESPDRIWCSRQHAVITVDNGQISVEDLNSLNGTFVNRTRVHPGQVKVIQENDVVQIGTVHLKLGFGA